MCLLIHRPRGAKTISDGWLDDFWSRNPDGFGAWWLDTGGEPRAEKTQSKARATEIVRLIEGADREAGYHWRLATHGATDISNVHPYPVSRGNRLIGYLGHNGILSRCSEKADNAFNKTARRGPSDTAIFIEEILEPVLASAGIRPLYGKKSVAAKLLAAYMGGNNKALLLTQHGFLRLGETEWTSWRGMKLSNTYAWSYSSRESEDGPLSAVTPFYGSDFAAGTGNSWDYRGNWKNDWKYPAANNGASIASISGGSTRGVIWVAATLAIPYDHYVYADDGSMVPGSEQDHRYMSYLDRHKMASAGEANQQPAQAATFPLVEDDITLQVLASMTFIEIVQWCQDEPEEAAAVIQHYLGAKSADI